MEGNKEDTKDPDDASIGSFDNDLEEVSNLPVVAIYDRIGGHMINAELSAAGKLFVEMTYTCARAYFESSLKNLCFNEFWFKRVFKEYPERICCLTYSACQSLLSKYSTNFERFMTISKMKLLDVDNLDMLHISFEPGEKFMHEWNGWFDK